MAKIYRKRGNKLNEVVTFDSACTRQENQPLVYDATDGSVHTTTHIGCLNADDVSVGNLTVTGQAIIQEQVTDTIDSNTLVLRSNADAGLTGTENSGVIIHNYNGSEDLYAVTDNTGTFRVGTAASTTTTYAYLRYNETDNKWYSTAPGVTPAVEVTPVGSPTSWDSVVTSGDDVEYTNIVFSVIDRTSLEPLTTRDESTDMEADYLTKWNSTDEKIITTGTSCTHDLCANGDITSTGDITAEGNVCVKTNITVDGNSCVSGDSTVSGEIHSCKCITAPTACVSDDLYVAGDINNCNTNSIIHGYYGCFENNVCIKGDLAIDGTIAVSSLTSDHVISVENTTNSSFYLPFVQNNHLVAGSNDLYTNGDLQYNPSTDVLCTKTFCSDRGIVQSAIYGVTAANLGLTAGTVYSLSTIVSCLQACCGNKAVSYLFSYAMATNPKVTEYCNDYAYNLTFEKLDNNSLSGTWTKSRWLVTGENGVSWTVTGTTTDTAGSITWTVCEHVVEQVCVYTAGGSLDYSLIFSACQSTPSCSKKTLFTDTANNLMYNPSTNTLKTCCVCACCDSYHARIASPAGSTCYAKITLNPDSLGENTAHLTFDVYGTKFELGVKEIASDSSKMSISYFTKTGDNGITCANVIDAKNKNVVYIKYSGYRPINITSDIPIKSITKSSTVPSDVSSTSWCAPTYDNATQYVNVTSTNSDFPILFNNCQATPAAGCKTLYNDSANNLMYNPSTNTLTTGTICAPRNIITPELVSPVPSAANQVSNLSFSSRCCNASSLTDYSMCLCGSNGVLYNPQGYNVPITKAASNDDTATASFSTDCYNCTLTDFVSNARSFMGAYGDRTNNCDYFVISARNRNGYGTSGNYGLLVYNKLANNSCHICYRTQFNGTWSGENQLIDSTGGQTIAGNLTVHNSSNNAVLSADCFALTSGKVRTGLYETSSTIVTGQAANTNVALATLVNCINENTSIGSGDTIGFVFSYAENVCVAFPNGKRGQLAGGNVQFDTLPNPFTWHTAIGTVSTAMGWEKFMMASSTSTYCSITELPYIGPVDTTSLKVCDMTIASSTSTPISLTCGSYKVRIDNYDNIVIGCATSTSGSGNIAIGKTVCASSYGVAIGCNTYAYNSAVAIGCNARGCSDCSVAIGCGSIACGSSTIALGTNTLAGGDGAVSIGYNATAHRGFLALGTCATSDIAIDTTMAGNLMFPYSSIIEMDDIKYGRHGRIKFVIPSCSKNIDITSFFNSLFISEINKGRCKNTWSTSSFENIPTLVAHLSGFYWDDGGSSDNYQRWAPGINGRGNINELILLNTSAGASSNISVYDLIVSCGKNICTDSWNWGKGTGTWSCGMVGVIEF